MKTEITVRVVSDDNGYFVAKAVGYPGVVTFGKSEDEAVSRIREAWNAMAQFNAIKSKDTTKPSAFLGASTETNIQLQFA